MIRAFIVAAAIAAAAIAAAPVATAVGKYSNCTQGIRTGDTTSHREIPTTGLVEIATTMASPASRDFFVAAADGAQRYAPLGSATHRLCLDDSKSTGNTMRHLMITLMAALTAVTLGFVAIAMSTPANADQFDFVSDLDSEGISYPNGSISNMIDLGKAVCHDLRVGTAPNMVVGKLGNVGYSGYEAGTIMGAAANAMCPDTWPVLSVFAHSATSPPAAYLPPDYDDGD